MNEADFAPTDVKEWRSGENITIEKLNEISEWLRFFFDGNFAARRYVYSTNRTITDAVVKMEELRLFLTTYGGNIHCQLNIGQVNYVSVAMTIGAGFLLDDEIYSDTNTDTYGDVYIGTPQRWQAGDNTPYHVTGEFTDVAPGKHTIVPVIYQNNSTYSPVIPAGIVVTELVQEVGPYKGSVFYGE